MSNARRVVAFQSGLFTQVDLKISQLGVTSVSRMASSLAGQVAFVTGGASGIGAALATKLAQAGLEVWIADRQIGPGAELAESLNNCGATAHAVELDVRDCAAF